MGSSSPSAALVVFHGGARRWHWAAAVLGASGSGGRQHWFASEVVGAGGGGQRCSGSRPSGGWAAAVDAER